MKGIESFGQNFIKGRQCSGVVSFQECLHKRETVFIVKDIQVPEHVLVFDVSAAEGHSLVEYCKCVTHRSVCLMGNHMQGFVVDCDSFAGGHHAKVPDYIVNCDPVEVVGLAT